jgi:hypothetical protein
MAGCGCEPEPWYTYYLYILHPRRLWWKYKWRVRAAIRKLQGPSLREKWYWAFHERPKLRATWTIEPAQDLCVYHSLDAEEELTKILLQEIDKEIEKELEQVEYKGPWETGIYSEYRPLTMDLIRQAPEKGLVRRYGPSSSLLPAIARGSTKPLSFGDSCSFPRALFWYTETPQALTLLRALWVPSWALTFDPIPPTGLGTREVQDLLETGLCLTPRSRISSSPSIITSLSPKVPEICFTMQRHKVVPLNLLRNDRCH